MLRAPKKNVVLPFKLGAFGFPARVHSSPKKSCFAVQARFIWAPSTCICSTCIMHPCIAALPRAISPAQGACADRLGSELEGTMGSYRCSLMRSWKEEVNFPS